MEIKTEFLDTGNVIRVTTIVTLKGKTYGDATTIIWTQSVKNEKAIGLEILESIKRHIKTIQERILKDA